MSIQIFHTMKSNSDVSALTELKNAVKREFPVKTAHDLEMEMLQNVGSRNTMSRNYDQIMIPHTVCFSTQEIYAQAYGGLLQERDKGNFTHNAQTGILLQERGNSNIIHNAYTGGLLQERGKDPDVMDNWTSKNDSFCVNKVLIDGTKECLPQGIQEVRDEYMNTMKVDIDVRKYASSINNCEMDETKECFPQFRLEQKHSVESYRDTMDAPYKPCDTMDAPHEPCDTMASINNIAEIGKIQPCPPVGKNPKTRSKKINRIKSASNINETDTRHHNQQRILYSEGHFKHTYAQENLDKYFSSIETFYHISNYHDNSHRHTNGENIKKKFVGDSENSIKNLEINDILETKKTNGLIKLNVDTTKRESRVCWECHDASLAGTCWQDYRDLLEVTRKSDVIGSLVGVTADRNLGRNCVSNEDSELLNESNTNMHIKNSPYIDRNALKDNSVTNESDCTKYKTVEMNRSLNSDTNSLFNGATAGHHIGQQRDNLSAKEEDQIGNSNEVYPVGIQIDEVGQCNGIENGELNIDTKPEGILVEEFKILDRCSFSGGYEDQGNVNVHGTCDDSIKYVQTERGVGKNFSSEEREGTESKSDCRGNQHVNCFTDMDRNSGTYWSTEGKKTNPSKPNFCGEEIHDICGEISDPIIKGFVKNYYKGRQLNKDCDMLFKRLEMFKMKENECETRMRCKKSEVDYCRNNLLRNDKIKQMHNNTNIETKILLKNKEKPCNISDTDLSVDLRDGNLGSKDFTRTHKHEQKLKSDEMDVAIFSIARELVESTGSLVPRLDLGQSSDEASSPNHLVEFSENEIDCAGDAKLEKKTSDNSAMIKVNSYVLGTLESSKCDIEGTKHQGQNKQRTFHRKQKKMYRENKISQFFSENGCKLAKNSQECSELETNEETWPNNHTHRKTITGKIKVHSNNSKKDIHAVDSAQGYCSFVENANKPQSTRPKSAPRHSLNQEKTLRGIAGNCATELNLTPCEGGGLSEAVEAQTQGQLKHDPLSAVEAWLKYQEMTPRIHDGTYSMWLCLPDELLLQIFAYLPLSDLANCAITNKHFHRISKDCSLWRIIKITSKQLTDDSLYRIGQHKPSSLALVSCRGDGVNDAGLRSLFRQTAACLKTLSITGCSTGGLNGDAVILQASVRCYNIRHLDISWTGLTSNSVTSISEMCSGLESLYISGCQCMTDTDMEGLLMKHGPTLQVLEVFGNLNLTQKSVYLIGQYCPHLTHLNLGQCYKITDQSVAHMCKTLSFLESLDIRGCNQIRDCVESVARNCGRMQCIVVANCPLVCDSSITFIVQLHQTLKYLDVRGCLNVTDDSIHQIINTCTQLSYVDISSTGCSNKSVFTMASSSSSNLQVVKLSFLNNLKPESVKRLLSSCRQLKTVHLYGCKLIKNMPHFVKANPDVVIEM